MSTLLNCRHSRARAFLDARQTEGMEAVLDVRVVGFAAYEHLYALSVIEDGGEQRAYPRSQVVRDESVSHGIRTVGNDQVTL